MSGSLLAHLWYIVFLGCGFTLLGFVAGFSLGEQNASASRRTSQGYEDPESPRD
jgi:hypothetical protein